MAKPTNLHIIPAADLPLLRARRAAGETLAAIGATYGVSRQRIQALLRDVPVTRVRHYRVCEVCGDLQEVSSPENARTRRCAQHKVREPGRESPAPHMPRTEYPKASWQGTAKIVPAPVTLDPTQHYHTWVLGVGGGDAACACGATKVFTVPL